MVIRLHDERTFETDAQTLLGVWKDEAFQRARSKHLGRIGAPRNARPWSDLATVTR